MSIADKKTVTLGLISDTHIPRWCQELPESVFELFDGVDLILHAGDVGELWVLDLLSQIAPVIAVHGNDEDGLTQKALPYLQTVAAANQRLVLTHGHYPDVLVESKMRANDDWYLKLRDYAAYGKDYGAGYVVTGHTHIPLLVQFEGVWLINPGAVSPGNDMVRQKLRSVAKLTLDTAGGFDILYYDLDNPAHTFKPQVDLAAGFKAAREQVQDSAFVREFEALSPWIWEQTPPALRPVMSRIGLRQAREYRAGHIPRITVQMMIDALISSESIPSSLIDTLRANPDLARFLK